MASLLVKTVVLAGVLRHLSAESKSSHHVYMGMYLEATADCTHTHSFPLSEAGLYMTSKATENITLSAKIYTSNQEKETFELTLQQLERKHVPITCVHTVPPLSSTARLLRLESSGPVHVVAANHYESNVIGFTLPEVGGADTMYYLVSNEVPSQFGIAAADTPTKLSFMSPPESNHFISRTEPVAAMVTWNNTQHELSFPFCIGLNAWEHVLIRGVGLSVHADLTGAKVISDSPVAIFVGHAEQQDGMTAKTLPRQWMVPLPAVFDWGNTFMIATRPVNDDRVSVARVIASEDNSSVWVLQDGTSFLTTLAKAGEFVQTQVKEPAAIYTSSKALVLLFRVELSKGGEAVLTGATIVPGVHKFDRIYTSLPSEFVTGNGDIKGTMDVAHVLVIIAKQEHTGGVRLDAQALESIWRPIWGMPYNFAYVRISDNSTHSVTHINSSAYYLVYSCGLTGNKHFYSPASSGYPGLESSKNRNRRQALGNDINTQTVIPTSTAASDIVVIQVFGSTGDAGDNGQTGPGGPNGSTGAIGPTGASGRSGDKGVKGDPGLPGSTGSDSAPGPRGVTGMTGMTGLTGPQGLTGMMGANSSTGAPGLPGPTGPTGLLGGPGRSGSNGTTGPTGSTGTEVTGDMGSNGDVGLPGTAGTVGMTGDVGDPGVFDYNPPCNLSKCDLSHGFCTPVFGSISYTCGCNSGYMLGADWTSCIDIDECYLGYCSESCTNYPGGYSCSCTNGYVPDNDSRTCLDVNECSNSSACPSSHQCINGFGSYLCVSYSTSNSSSSSSETMTSLLTATPTASGLQKLFTPEYFITVLVFHCFVTVLSAIMAALLLLRYKKKYRMEAARKQSIMELRQTTMSTLRSY